MSVSFLLPGALWFMLLVPLALWMGRGCAPQHLLLRGLLIAATVLALAQPVWLRDDGAARQVIVLDQRDWLGEETRAAGRDTLARMLAEASDADRVALVQLGGSRVAVDGVEWIGLLQNGDLGDALVTAQAAIAPGERGSIVAIADPRNDTSDWNGARDTIAARSIPLNFVATDGSPGAARIVSATARPGAAGSAGMIEVQLMGAGEDVSVELREDGRVIDRSEPVEIDGTRTLSLDLDRREPGFDTYEVGLSGEASDRAISVTIAGDDPMRVALMRGKGDGTASLQNLVGPGFLIRLVSPTGGGGLDGFDLVVIDDIPLSRIPAGRQADLREAIARRGKGLVYAGGQDAFAKVPPGAPLGQALPFMPEGRRMVEKPSVALAIVIDSSGSMQGKLLELAKQTARLAVARLTAQDQVGVVEFYGSQQWAVPMQYARDTAAIGRSISRMEAQGSSILYPAIQEALFGLKRVDARYKHILVISDAGVEQERYEQLIRFIARDRINLSTVLVGNDPEGEKRMADWARWGRGRYYAVRDEFGLVQVDFARPETKPAPGWRNGSFAVRTNPAVGWWDDLALGAMPPVEGYAPGTVRPGAQSLATVAGGAPLLTSWQYGAGRVTALAVDPVGQGTARWRGWRGYGEWLARVLIGTAQRAESLSIDAVREGANVQITVRREGVGTAIPTLRAAAAGQPLAEIALTRNGPSLFSASLAAAPASELLIEASEEGRSRRIVLEPSEGRGTADRVLPLAGLAQETGGLVVGPDEALPTWPTSAGTSEKTTPLWQLLSLLALMLYLADIVWRRFPRRRSFS